MKTPAVTITENLELEQGYFLPGEKVYFIPGEVSANGGLEGADRTSRELASWASPISSPDQLVNTNKEILDARGRDMTVNDGYVIGALATHKDSIVGSQFNLNARPHYKLLGLDEKWADEFQEEVEAKFMIWAESINCWPDAQRINTLTGLVRLAVGTHFMCGEVLASAEWIRMSDRFYNTAIQMVETDRLCNPDDMGDTATLRRGIERNQYGQPMAYHIRNGYRADPYMNNDALTWTRVEARKPWGRQQIIHIHEQIRPDQSRGISEMVSVLKQMKMTQKFQDISLQQAVLNATYAATIESELPPEAAYAQLGQGGTTTWAKQFLSQVAAYSGNSRNLSIDGVKIPHLYPGTKFKLLNAGAPNGVGENFEQSLLRHTAAGLGLSYEEFSRDYTKTNYSSARAANVNTDKYMRARKKVVADKTATSVYALWLEEAISKGEITTVTKSMPNYWERLNKEAYIRCNWIGSARGQIDELKETQASVLRIQQGLSTFEKELGRTGEDFREIFAQQAREAKLREKLGITIAVGAPMIAGQGAHAGQAQDSGAGKKAVDDSGDDA